MVAARDLAGPGGNDGIDVVIPMLHGTFGEDGTMQGLLELAGLAYVGAGVLASAAAMDKEVTKRLCRSAVCPSANTSCCSAANSHDAHGSARHLPFPLFVKPANLGSSVGISKVHHESELGPALQLAAQFDTHVIVERGIDGRRIRMRGDGQREPAPRRSRARFCRRASSTITKTNTCWTRRRSCCRPS